MTALAVAGVVRAQVRGTGLVSVPVTVLEPAWELDLELESAWVESGLRGNRSGSLVSVRSHDNTRPLSAQGPNSE